MDGRKRQLVTEVGGDPSDETWLWFMCRGPHGPAFTWGASRQEPAGYVGLDHLKKVIDERTALEAGFPGRLRMIARAAAGSSDTGVIRRALQVLAVVGGSEDIPLIEGLVAHAADVVTKDAKAALFELRRRIARSG